MDIFDSRNHDSGKLETDILDVVANAISCDRTGGEIPAGIFNFILGRELLLVVTKIVSSGCLCRMN